MKKILSIMAVVTVALLMSACSGSEKNNDEGEYLDLGLPSGTLWKCHYEEGGLYTYEEAMLKWGKNIPSKSQIEELLLSCKWDWTGEGMLATGPNGAILYLPAAGMWYYDGINSFEGQFGSFWSATSKNDTEAYYLVFYSTQIEMPSFDKNNYGASVLLVK